MLFAFSLKSAMLARAHRFLASDCAALSILVHTGRPIVVPCKFLHPMVVGGWGALYAVAFSLINLQLSTQYQSQGNRCTLDSDEWDFGTYASK